MSTRRVVAEARMKFGPLEEIGAGEGGASTYVAPDLPLLRENDDAVNSLRDAQGSESGDRLSPIGRQRPPSAPDLQQPPSHRRGHEGPTTPKAPASAPTPKRTPAAPSREGPAASRPSPAHRARPSVGPHDFARGMAPRPAIPIPPHAQSFAARSGSERAAGSARNRIMHRGAAPLAATPAPTGRAFLRHVYDAARRAGIPETQARLAAAQAAHESAYGRRAPGHNYFGVKGAGTAGSQMLRTHEQGRRGLYATTSRFARYAAPEDSLKHWWAKIQRQWPGAAGASNFDDAVRGLRAGRRGGYATDARYNEKIRRVAASLPPPSTGASPRAVAGGATPQGQVPQTSTAGR
jgi:flagellum-specific peptidoglycan hydrolase FlgJ